MLKAIKKTLLITGVAILTGIAIFFLCRNALLKYVVVKVQHKVAGKYGASLLVKDASFKGLLNVDLQQLTFSGPGSDTLLKVQELILSPRLSGLFTLNPKFDKIEVDAMRLQLRKDSRGYNFSFLLKQKRPADSLSNTKQGYNGLFKRLFNAAFGYVPDEVVIHQLNATYTEESDTLRLKIPDVSLHQNRLSMILNFYNSYSAIRSWFISANINRGGRRVAIQVLPDRMTAKPCLPFIDKAFNTIIAFDTAYFALSSHSSAKDVFSISGNMRVTGLLLNHPRLSTTDVSIKQAAFNYKFNIGNNFMEIDSTSTAAINAIHFNPYIRYEPKPLQALAVSLHLNSMPANDFFASLPDGMFSSVHGLRADGNLSYRLFFKGDLKMPDSLRFQSGMRKEGFRIKYFGEEDLTKMNGSFTYTAYEKGIPVKTFTVGPENPGFTPLGQIPAYLGNALLNSEDGSFFGHRGFNEEAFRKSIAENIQQGRFARGGSTITMQLVKNVFLSRNKTIARKAEEALIVWLIENNGLCSKARMYEVYLNIIEWGPRIYGIKEAAQFYFLKQPMQLSLAECIFLVSIVPRPKGFMYSFDGTGNLRPDLEGYYRIISDIMLRKGQITAAEYDALQSNVKLTGPAQFYLKNAPPAPPDDDE